MPLRRTLQRGALFVRLRGRLPFGAELLCHSQSCVATGSPCALPAGGCDAGTGLGCGGAGIECQCCPAGSCSQASQCSAQSCAGSDYLCAISLDAGFAWSPPDAGAACDDRDPCTVNDLCEPDGGCAGTPVACVLPPNAQCYQAVGSCSGGVCSYAPKAAGTVLHRRQPLHGERCLQWIGDLLRDADGLHHSTRGLLFEPGLLFGRELQVQPEGQRLGVQREQRLPELQLQRVGKLHGERQGRRHAVWAGDLERLLQRQPDGARYGLELRRLRHRLRERQGLRRCGDRLPWHQGLLLRLQCEFAVLRRRRHLRHHLLAELLVLALRRGLPLGKLFVLLLRPQRVGAAELQRIGLHLQPAALLLRVLKGNPTHRLGCYWTPGEYGAALGVVVCGGTGCCGTGGCGCVGCPPRAGTSPCSSA